MLKQLVFFVIGICLSFVAYARVSSDINAGEGLVAIVIRENNVDTYHYVYTDHLGSILTVTNSTGTITAQQNFDAWGRRRNATTWAYTTLDALPTWFYRGYTGHEQLPEFRLINMNGRLYDPALGRMLSADDYLQGGTQGYNRYSYALNNPLKYTDPSGEVLWFVPVIAAVVHCLFAFVPCRLPRWMPFRKSRCPRH